MFLIIVCRRYDEGMEEDKGGSVAQVAAVIMPAEVRAEVRVLQREHIRTVMDMLIKEMVDYPDSVAVGVIVGEQTTVFEVSCKKEDLGKIIGKQGKTVSGLREILKAMSGKIKLRAILDVKE